LFVWLWGYQDWLLRSPLLAPLNAHPGAPLTLANYTPQEVDKSTTLVLYPTYPTNKFVWLWGIKQEDAALRHLLASFV
jgi:hypothetical protein